MNNSADRPKLNPIDIEKPELKPGEKLCGGCWSVSATGVTDAGWVYFNFKYLEPTWLCVDCLKERGLELIKMQGHGL